MNKKLTKSPLTYVLVKVSISPILDIEKYLGALQESIRIEFPEVKSSEVKDVELSGNSLSINTIKQWHFIDKNHTMAVLVDKNSIVIRISQYNSVANIKSKLENILTKFNDILKIQLYHCVAIRYINAIPDNIDIYLPPELLGFFPSGQFSGSIGFIPPSNQLTSTCFNGAFFFIPFHLRFASRSGNVILTD